jgi:CRP-like cAMP-binding protein
MRGGAKPKLRKVKVGTALMEQGKPGDELFFVVDGVVSVEVDGTVVAELGPGALLGERAVLEGGTRTATIKAVTPCRVAVASADVVDRDALRELSEGHRREETSG